MVRPVQLVALLAIFAVMGPWHHAKAEPTCVCDETGAVSGTKAPLDLNTATEEDLMSLPGVGRSRAKAILAFRESHGGFTRVAQLMSIRGFGRAMLRRLRPLVTVAAPATRP